MKKIRVWSLLLLSLLFIDLPILAGVALYVPGPLKEKTVLVIEYGARGRDIAALLDKNHVVWHPLLFRLGAKILARGEMKAGEYEFTPHQSILEIVRMLREGRAVARFFTLPEGLTAAEAVDLLNKEPILTGTITVPPEGSLLPETYRYTHGDARGAIVTRMQKSMSDTLAELWPKRDPAVPLRSPAEAVIMASIIEKETGKPEERARIAGVFCNRLKYPMRLQSDPTVIYALTKGRAPLGRTLTRDDLAIPSPYNTYTSDGLPPDPICNPGRAALAAALHPEQHDFLYFVADGTGGHVFARDLAAHNRNVAKWIGEKAKETPRPPVKPF